MADRAMVGIDVFHHMGHTQHFDLHTQFFLKLAFQGRLPGLAKLDSAAQRAHPFEFSVVVINFCRK
ncbi:hypothetical protein D3C71_1902900 [compost metagenome]